jgi:hypothetical protein
MPCPPSNQFARVSLRFGLGIAAGGVGEVPASADVVSSGRRKREALPQLRAHYGGAARSTGRPRTALVPPPGAMAAT